MIEADQISVQDVVNKYLKEEINSGDPARVKSALEAQEANREYGLGGWVRSHALGGVLNLGPTTSATGTITPLRR